MGKIKFANKIFILIYLFSVLVFLAHFIYVGDGVWGDGRYYYSYLRSVVLDRNLDFSNEFEYFKIPLQYSQTGVVINKFAIGPAIFWLPFFLLAHILTFLLKILGFSLVADGYSWPYQVMVGVGSVSYAISGLYLCFLALKQRYKARIALISCLGIYFASNLFFYSAIDPINSHSLSFFTSSLLFYLVTKYWQQKELRIKNIVLLGILTGLVTLIRNQDGIWGLIPIYLILNKSKSIISAKVRSIVSLLHCFIVKTKNITLFIISFIFVLIPQFLVWQIMFGQISSPYLLLGEKFYWLNPQIFNVWFSSNHGLFFYSPILILSIWGLLNNFSCGNFMCFKSKIYSLTKLNLICQRQNQVSNKVAVINFNLKHVIGILGLMLFTFQTWIVGSWHSWWAGESYGNRMFISLTPLFIFGLADFFNTQKINLKLYFMISFFIVLNMGMIIKYLLSF